MYNKLAVNKLIKTIQAQNGIGDKAALTKCVQTEFGLTRDRSVYYCQDFAIRFSSAKHAKMGNTILGLSALQKFDAIPFVVCIVTPNRNYLLLANTTFLAKISHSSQELRIDNIRGGFNGSDIMRQITGIENIPENFADLFDIHSSFTFEENLVRLVEKSNDIVPTGSKFMPTPTEVQAILDAPQRALDFFHSSYYADLKADLSARATAVQSEIAIAAFIENVNIRGRIIEYLITESDSTLKEQLIDSLHNKKPLPAFKTANGLGDYAKTYMEYITETDIKTKVFFLDGNPKAYNVDKLLQFLATEKSVYLIFLVGIEKSGKLCMELCPVFQKQLLDATAVIAHWAGRNSRGVTQFHGHSLVNVLDHMELEIDIEKSKEFVRVLMS